VSEQPLYDWLVDVGVADEVRFVRKATAAVGLSNLDCKFDESEVNAIEWARLLLAGSILSRSESRRHKEVALTIATGAVVLRSSSEVSDAGAVLFNDLANERSIELAISKGIIPPDLYSRLGTSLRIETERRKVDSSVLVQSSGRHLAVNEFQKEFWLAVSNDNGWLSASAPTASGKTFLVLQWLVDQFRAGYVSNAVYLAPTRALISEIEDGLQSLLIEGDGVRINSMPIRSGQEQANKYARRTINVFTQERIHIFLNSIEKDDSVDVLIVDEAHKIGDDSRGVILQDAIERLNRSNPNLKVVFVSPATQNPGILLEDAPDGSPKRTVDSDFPTVLQNLILAQQVPRKPREWALQIRDAEQYIDLGVLHLNNKPGSVKKKLAFIAAAVGEAGGTLVYANGAAEAEAIALLISQIPKIEKSEDEELLALSDLVRKGVHTRYQLASVVERGVAFHYGNMPSLIRREVERLFRSGKIRYLVCTSTLVEGVNLSCRTIVVRGPRKGRGHPMEAHDFWNLAGRAGRWGSEFQGNIICVDPADTDAWPSGVPVRARYPITRESDSVMNSHHKLNEYLDRMIVGDRADNEFDHQLETVSAFLLSNFLRAGSLKEAAFASRRNPAELEILDEKLRYLSERIEVPSEVALRHPGVNAFGLQRLLDHFQNYDGNLENLIPAPVESFDAYDRFVTIMEKINRYVYPAFMPEGLVPLHALVVIEWLKGYSLANIIKRRISYQEDNNRTYKLPNLIRGTMDLVEQTARFRAPRYVAAYMDVLKFHFLNIGRSDLIEDELDWGVALEFGVSTKTLLSLLELGLSRMSSVILYENIAEDGYSQQGCIEWISEHRSQFDGMGIPKIISIEVDKVLRSRSSNT